MNLRPFPTPGSFFGAVLWVALSCSVLAAEKTAPAGPAVTAPFSSLIDPATGLPLPPWLDPAWKDPGIMLREVSYEAMPVHDIAQQLRIAFKDSFDILIPREWRDTNNEGKSINPSDITVFMQLKNVTASQVFNAMNLVFEAENTPCRWELKLNGDRPTALLRLLPQLLPSKDPRLSPPKMRQVYFVGDLIGDESSGRMSINQFLDRVGELYTLSYGSVKDVVQFHKDTQLLIITGTAEQTGFVQQILSALRERARAQQQKAAANPFGKPRPEESKPQ